MKRIITIISAIALIVPSFKSMAQSDPQGTLSYALPQTSLTFEVEAQKEQFYAGPYAKYAQKYLGIDVRTENETTYQLLSVKMTPYIEADQSKRYVVTPGAQGAHSFLQLTAQGLVSVSDGNFGNGSEWRFPKKTSGDFSDMGVGSNLTSEATTLYKTVKTDNSYNKIAVQQDMVVEKPLEKRAQEAANMIFDLRSKRVQIVTGDTDATYSGEAMASALAEIKALEDEYMTMFIGYSDYQVQKMKFDVVPTVDQKNQVYVPFRLSDTEGLVASDNMSGKPYLLELKADPVSAPAGVPDAKTIARTAVYRIPAICTVKLSDGVNVILQDRIPVYQLGKESSFPLSTK